MDETSLDNENEQHLDTWEEALPEEPSRAPWRSLAGTPMLAIAVGAVTVAAAAAWIWWPRAPASEAAIALPAVQLPGARAALVRAGIHARTHDGALWVAAIDAHRALEALGADRPAPNAMASASADESIFASAESSRARRLGATMQALESAIAQQASVARAQVVLAEPTRTMGPGSSNSACAAVTVSMRTGAMPQDLVDAVAVLVAGAVPGMRPEQVAILDAGAGRARLPRSVEARAIADVVRAREERSSMLLAAMLADIPEVSVLVRESDGGGVVATVALPRAYAIARAERETQGDLDALLARERDRIAAIVQPFLACPSGACPTAVAVALAAEGAESPPRETTGIAAGAAGEGTLTTPPAAPYTLRSAAQVAVDRAAQRERETPLGSQPGAATSFPIAWSMVALMGIGALAWWSWRRPRAGAAVVTGMAANARIESMPDDSADQDLAPALQASEAVRTAPEQAALVVRGWLDAGYDARVAHLIVALDAGAAGVLLRTLSVREVQRATAALGETEAPSRQELAEAAHGFLEEAEMIRAPSAYRAAPEAA